MLFDRFALRQIQSPFGNMAMAMNGNLNFAQNAVEQLSLTAKNAEIAKQPSRNQRGDRQNHGGTESWGERTSQKNKK